MEFEGSIHCVVGAGVFSTGYDDAALGLKGGKEHMMQDGYTM